MRITLTAPDMTPLYEDVARMRAMFEMDKHNFGKELLNATAITITDCCAREQDADGVPWPQLGPTYKQWKDTFYPGNPIGVLLGIMQQPVEIEGVQGIGTNQAFMTYGVTAAAREHATSFQEGALATGMMGHKPRPFYYIGRAVELRIERIADQHFQNHVLIV